MLLLWVELDYSFVVDFESFEFSCDSSFALCDTSIANSNDPFSANGRCVGNNCQPSGPVAYSSGSYISPSSASDGLCASTGIQTCSGGVWGSDTCVINWAASSTEVCGDHIDNDCNGVDDPCCTVIGECDSSFNGFSCDGYDYVVDVSAVSEVCPGVVDDNCNGVVAEDAGGSCYGYPGCNGMLDCSLFTDPSSCPIGCFESPGVCSVSGFLCDGARPCVDAPDDTA